MILKIDEDVIEKCEDVIDYELPEVERDDASGIIRIPKTIILHPPVKNTPEQIAKKRTFWREFMNKHGVVKIVAPMVGRKRLRFIENGLLMSFSELAFRMFMRKYGAHVTVTPMIHAHLFVNDTTYRRNALALCEADRPLIVQFCANKPDTFLAACRLVEGYCDGVDLNLGCPQMVAKKGRYGAYLQ
ncbi:unnamed protein product, partial [Cylicostephanus goldi]